MDTLNSRYEKKMEPREFDKLFTNGKPVIGGAAANFELKTGAITNLDIWIHKHIKNVAGIAVMLKNGSFAMIEDVDDLAHAYKSFSMDASKK